MERSNRTKVRVVLFASLATIGLPVALVAYPTESISPLAWIVFVAGVGAVALWLIMAVAIHAVGLVRHKTIAVE